MFCPNCGKEISDTSIYCNKCGQKVSGNEMLLVKEKDIPTAVEEIELTNSQKPSSKRMVIGIILLIVIAGSIFGIYQYVQTKNFNNLVKSASQKLNEGKYDEAIQSYTKALTYKNDENIKKELDEAKNYKQYQNIYNEGIKLMNDKKYSDAIQKLNTVSQNVSLIYNNAQNKIQECKKQIINEDIQAANNSIKNGDYDTANKYIEDILKLDANNNDAKQLKTTIEQAQEKSKEDTQAKAQKQMENNSITINYSIDEKGYIIDANYPNGSSIQMKKGQTINLVGNVSPKSSQRVLFDGIIMESVSPTVIKTISVGGGDLNIIPNGYDWDKAYKYHIIVSN